MWVLYFFLISDQVCITHIPSTACLRYQHQQHRPLHLLQLYCIVWPVAYPERTHVPCLFVCTSTYASSSSPPLIRRLRLWLRRHLRLWCFLLCATITTVPLARLRLVWLLLFYDLNNFHWPQLSFARHINNGCLGLQTSPAELGSVHDWALLGSPIAWAQGWGSARLDVGSRAAPW
jgi:hypothetical protein